MGGGGGRREGYSHESWSLSMGRASLCYSTVVLDFATMLKSQFAEQDGDTLSPEACS